jgi:hypothetical protein
MDPLYGTPHEENDPGVRHQAMDTGDTFDFDDRILRRGLAGHLTFSAI